MPEMMKKQQYQKKIHNWVPDGDDIASEVSDAFVSIQRVDLEQKAEAHQQQKGYKSYVLKEVANIRIGTERAVNNFCVHARKGCMRDLLPMNKMSIRIDPDDDMSELLHLRSTSGGKSANKQINRLTQNIGSMTAELGCTKLMLRIFWWNLDKDRRLQKVLCLHQGAPRS